MAYKSSYTGEVMDEILAKSKSFTKNDESWTVFSSSITTLDVSNVMKPGNYIYSGNLFIPEMEPLYGYTKSTRDSMTLTGSYMIFVRRINYNIYQFINAHSIYDTNDATIVIAWIRQPNYSYIPRFYYNNEPSNAMFGFATSETFDKGTHKYPNQIRKFNNESSLKYYDEKSKKYVSFVEGGAMPTSIYGNVEDVFTMIDNTVPAPIDYSTHMNDSSIHMSMDEKAIYTSKLTSDTVTTTLDSWENEFLNSLNTQIKTVKNQISAINSDASQVQSRLSDHIADNTLHPTTDQISIWDSKADIDHTHTEDQITISVDDVVGVVNPENISDEAKEIQVTVTSSADLLSLTKSDVHNGCWVLLKSTSGDITYYVVVDDTKLGNEAAFQQLSTSPYSAADLVWSNVSNKPTTIDELGVAVSNADVDTMVNSMNALATTADSSINAIADKAEPLTMHDNSFAMENLIDLIDYKMQLIENLLSSNSN